MKGSQEMYGKFENFVAHQGILYFNFYFYHRFEIYKDSACGVSNSSSEKYEILFVLCV
jgi:hypothetical protein